METSSSVSSENFEISEQQSGFKKTNRLSWWIFGIGVIFWGVAYLSQKFTHYAWNISPIPGMNLNLWSLIGLMIVVASIIISILAVLMRPIEPLENRKFWLKRVFFDIAIANYVLPFFLVIAVRIFLALVTSGHYKSSTTTSFTSLTESITNLSPLVFLVSAGTVQLGISGFVAARAYFKTLPKSIIQTSFRNLWKQWRLIVMSLLLILVASFMNGLIFIFFKIQLPPQFAFTPDIKTGYWLVLLSGVILAPCAEELFFRGYILSILSAKNKWLGLIVTSLIFASVHLRLLGFLQLFIIGFILGYSYLKTKNLLVPITIHAIYNLLIFSMIIFVK